MGYYVEVEAGVSVYVEDSGFGKPVLLVHGWPLNRQMFEYQTSWLPQHGYRCISVDLRGFGRSDRPWHGYSYDRLADDLRVVVEALRLEKFILVGFSMGGAVVIRYMSRYGGHSVEKLVLLAAAAPSATRRPGFPYGMTREELGALIVQAYTNRPQMLEDFGKLFFASRLTDSFREWIQLINLSGSAQGTIACAMSLRDEDLRGDLGRVNAPTAILHGALDRICPYPLAQAMHQGIRGSRLYRFEQSGHGIFYDELERFNHTLLAVLEGGG